MKKSEKIYEELKKKLTDEEIVERYVLPEEISEAERQVVEEEFRSIRMDMLKARSEQQRLLSELMRMKLLIKDYLKTSQYDEAFSFAHQLQAYIKIIDRPKKVFAREIDIHPTRLSRILSGKESANIELVYRLEKHCGQLIPAIYWWKLHARRLEYLIQKDEQKRLEESHKVKNHLKFRA
jgi:plasmid maintenance system antidote protein VapI